MLNHAFQWVDRVLFEVGATKERSVIFVLDAGGSNK